MNICVGGELDGQMIEKEGRLLKASDIDPSFKTEYYKQVFNRDNTVFLFWLPIGSDLHDMSKKVLNILRSPKN
ncbi:hypothetical protein [Acinetobacter baumannii]|uniref:hypothetical protein n=1 Tax=Acinetobacter baumannii TaxID=470 RepID=UPI0004A0A29A|nr:hypothetical protein [Acinetobacter baumannii]KCX65434.1 hypothetical protein J560_4320 [Acinetobacter baumannii 855125]KCX69710.1 hypothetical protein J560_3798 [Acinetobacter baumannii 855125]MDC4634073.1 hypothetical protein [Acinetobacter baumannii]MDC5170566.1 hypothetical protein [Acinetobacter baumannii]MDC5271051.1 hypothetical protein [Acinetobacter baumannii]